MKLLILFIIMAFFGVVRTVARIDLMLYSDLKELRKRLKKGEKLEQSEWDNYEWLENYLSVYTTHKPYKRPQQTLKKIEEDSKEKVKKRFEKKFVKKKFKKSLTSNQLKTFPRKK